MLPVGASEQRVSAVAVGVLPAAMDAALAAKSTNSRETKVTPRSGRYYAEPIDNDEVQNLVSSCAARCSETGDTEG
jgi:hypothetical protein